MNLISTGIAILLAAWIPIRFFVSRKRSGKFNAPRGPRGVPFFGNEFQVPSNKQWLQFHDWSRQYGDVLQITLMGQPVVILSSSKAGLDLLETRGNIYSDRPRTVMAGELVGWDRGLRYTSYGERFKDFRKMFHQAMGPRSLCELYPLQERENAHLLFRLLEEPEAFVEHARQSSGAFILMLVYGYAAKLKKDPLVKIAEETMLGFSKASELGAYIVDRFPWLRYIPSWLPGTYFKAEAKQMRQDLQRLYDVPFDFVQCQMTSCSFVPCFTSRYLSENPNASNDRNEFVKAAAASLYSGGADTTPSSITAFILAMTLYPEVQARGQAEVEALLNLKRLPTHSDREFLPYVSAIVKEILRWNPAVPLVQDDYYRNFRLSKGSIVWANIWSILHDESIFPEPYIFRPERFVDENGKLRTIDRSCDPSSLAFGFGRRICPGMYLADSSIFLTVASILMVFDIAKVRDAAGGEIKPEVDFSGFISHPKPFQCVIRPRSEEAVAFIKCCSSEIPT